MQSAAECAQEDLPVSLRKIYILAMKVLANIVEDPALMAKVTEEREHYLQILRRRGAIFMEEAEKAGLHNSTKNRTQKVKNLLGSAF